MADRIIETSDNGDSALTGVLIGVLLVGAVVVIGYTMWGSNNRHTTVTVDLPKVETPATPAPAQQ